MREILFRGKRTDNGEWVEGFCEILNEKLAYMLTPARIHTDINMVVPESISEFTGLTDKNGKKIFEGDILKICIDDSIKNRIFSVDWRGYATDGYGDYEANEYIVIGNIYDNPELLKEGVTE